MPFDANKLYCSEVLAILLQDNDGECPHRDRPGWEPHSVSDPVNLPLASPGLSACSPCSFCTLSSCIDFVS
jgi:hypothetical protein